jgi:GTP-binding protein
LLSKLSDANPKIASYPFTTLEPQLGVMQYKYYDPCIIADIPGLIEGAHSGVGLGHKFLRHIERTSILLHVLDSSDVMVRENFETISKELQLYKEELAGRTMLLVLNKVDLIENTVRRDLEKYFQQMVQHVITVSGLTGEGIDRLKEVLVETLDGSGKA